VVWDNTLHRPTKDIDLLGIGNRDKEDLLIIFKTIASQQVDTTDGLAFKIDEFKAIEITKEGNYQGVRVK